MNILPSILASAQGVTLSPCTGLSIAQLTPEFILVGLAIVLLMLDCFCKNIPKRVFAILGVVGLLVTLPCYTESFYDNFYAILATIATALTLLLAFDYKAVINDSSNESKSQDGTGEFYILPLIACAGITALTKAQDLVTLFVSLELLTLSSYIMVAYFRRNLGSLEAGVKYLILGAVSTGVLVMGIAWYYGMTGSFNLQMPIVLSASVIGNGIGLLFALTLMLLGTAFKIGAVPMQMWVPDVYQGAPTPVTAFLSVASKVAGFSLLATLLGAFVGAPKLFFVLAIMAAATLIVGNLGAIAQTNMKRLLGYSSIAQAGFILPLFLFDPQHISSMHWDNVPVYLCIYLVATFGAFFALAQVRIQRGSEEISAFRGLGKTNPRLAFGITVCFASLAGVPLTAGFFAKMASFLQIIQTEQYLYWLLPIMIITAATGFYYYFKVIREMYWKQSSANTAPLHMPVVSSLVLIGCVLFLLGVGIAPLFTM